MNSSTTLKPKPLSCRTQPGGNLQVDAPQIANASGKPQTGIAERIIEDKTAAAGGDNKTESTTPVINITVDTDPIAKLLEAQAATATKQFEQLEQQLKDTVAAQNDRIAELAGAPRQVSDPGDLDTPKSPSTYIVANSTAMDTKAALREFEEIYEKSHAIEFDGGRAVGVLTARDTRLLDRFVASNREVLQQAMQEHGYKHGLFRAAATSLTDIPASFSGYLSSIMRQTPRWGKIWHQFLNPVLALGVGVGNRVDVPRLGRISRPTASANWVLSGNGFATTSQNITNGYEKVEVGMYGMGEPSQNNDPVGVNEYLRKHSILDLEAQIQNELGENFNEFREIITYEQYAATPEIRYYKASTKTIESVATAMTAADNGMIDVDSLIRLRAHMNGDMGIIPWPDGCYVLVCHPNAVIDLEIELKNMGKPITKMEIEELTNIIKVVNTALTSQISGYRFSVGGFHIFAHENLPPDPNFMKSSTGAAATLRNWYDNIAFGPMAVCECISMPPEVRRDEMRQFGTMDRYIWLMYGKYQAIERGTPSTGAGLGQRTQIVKFRSGRS
jgi:hypothetical protein